MRHTLTVSKRTRQTPLHSRVLEQGVKAFTVYNRMLLPTVFSSLEEDYRHLKCHVQVWDVGCERQTEIKGPDSTRLVQMLTPRNMKDVSVGQCAYAPVVDETGGMLNDPVFLKISDHKYWISAADSDLLYWIKGLAYGFRLDVDVNEPEIWPIAVQGPKAEALTSRIFGDQINAIQKFTFKHLTFRGEAIIVARSGYSNQQGFELYPRGKAAVRNLWDKLFATGKDLDIRAGAPNLIERVEAGLLSYGNDMDRVNTPYECGLSKFCDTDKAIGCVGRDALIRSQINGLTKQIRSIEITGKRLSPCSQPWVVYANDEEAGEITSAAWSPGLQTNVALGMIQIAFANKGTEIEVETPEGVRSGIIRKNSFT